MAAGNLPRHGADALKDISLDAPSLREALREWLESQKLSPPGGQLRVSGGGFPNLWQLFDYCNQVEMAGRVLQGYYLAQIKSTAADSFEAGLRAREITHATAYRLVENYVLFNSLPNLSLLGRASQLGSARLRELKPELGLDGIHALVQGDSVQGLTYEDACKMSKRDIIAWHKERRRHRLQRRIAQDRAAGLMGPDMGPTSALAAKEPQEVVTAREEALAITWRIRAELALLQQAFAPLAPAPGTELGSAHFGAACLMARGLSDVMSEAAALHAAITQRFGDAVTRADGVVGTDAQAQAMRKIWIAEVEAAAAERIRERHHLNGWRGRPATRRPLGKTGKGKRGRPRKAR